MERKCSVCGSPMVRTATGYRCTFCVNVEPLNGKAREYEGARPNVPRNTGTGQYGYSNQKKPQLGKAGSKGFHGVSNRMKPVVIVGAAIIMILILAAFILKVFLTLAFRNQENKDDYRVKGDESISKSVSQEETSTGTEYAIESPAMKQAVEEMFQKPFDEVTEEEIQTIRYLQIDISGMDDSCIISYSFENYKDYAPDGMDSEMFAYNEEFLSTIKTYVYTGEDFANDIIYYDVHNFRGVSGVCLDDYRYADLSGLTNLSYVDAGDADMTKLMKTGISTSNIEALKLQNVEAILNMGEFTSLTKLYLDGCEIKELKNVAECQSLDTLYCVNLQGTESVNAIGQLTGLKTLYIDGLPDGEHDLSMISELTDLEHLTIMDTDILNIHFLSGLTSLKGLCLADNGELQELAEMGNLVNLEYLDLDLNALNGKQPEYACISNLKNLKHLSLNTVYDLDFLYELTNLEELEIKLCFYNNLLEPIRKMSHLKELTLIQCNSQYPDGFACLQELPELKKLTIENMSFQERADGLFRLDTLEELHVRSCQFYTIPSDIAANKSLKVLELTYVEFMMMPEAEKEYYDIGYDDEEIMQDILNQYGDCSGLKELYIEGCALKDLAFLHNLSALKVLSMPHCQIQTIEKEDMAGCMLIEELYLQENQISDLNFVTGLSHLRSINLEKCNVSDLSPLTFCKRLRYVNVKENPIAENPLEGAVVED